MECMHKDTCSWTCKSFFTQGFADPTKCRDYRVDKFTFVTDSTEHDKETPLQDHLQLYKPTREELAK